MSALSEKQIKDYNKALSLFQSGQFRDAEGVLKRLYKAAPEHTEINALLADCRFMTGKYDVALRDYARALRLDPNLAGAWKRIGHIEFAIKNNLAVAIEMLSKALALNPTDAETYYLLGTISQQMVQHADSAQMFQIGLQLAPKHAEMRAALALSQLDLRDFDAVKSNILQALKDAPQSDMVIVTALKISEVLPFSDDEETMIRKIAKENAGRGDLLSYVATYEAQRAMAEKDYDAALKILQDVDDKHLSIAPTKYFYLGKIYLSRKQYDQSFAAYERANDLTAKTKAASKYKQSSFKDIIGLVDKAFDVPDFAAQVKKAGSQLQDRPYQSPVFLVGFPRSGTTLSGRILDQHPKLTTSDEIGAIDLIKLHAAQKFNANFSDHIDRIDADMLRYFVDFYNTTQREIPSSMKTGERFIDKMPFNHVNAAVIETVFPRAKFISITRHPLDAVLSCYMQNFRMNTAMVNFLDIENGAKIYRTVYHLWQKQKRVLDLDVHEFRYEDMVADFDTEVGRVLDFIGVEWDDSVREFYRGDGNAPATLTPSRTQVSQKLFTGSQNRWRHFRKHLEPAIEILEPIIEELGYSVDPAEGE